MDQRSAAGLVVTHFARLESSDFKKRGAKRPFGGRRPPLRQSFHAWQADSEGSIQRLQSSRSGDTTLAPSLQCQSSSAPGSCHVAVRRDFDLDPLLFTAQRQVIAQHP